MESVKKQVRKEAIPVIAGEYLGAPVIRLPLHNIARSKV